MAFVITDAVSSGSGSGPSTLLILPSVFSSAQAFTRSTPTAGRSTLSTSARYISRMISAYDSYGSNHSASQIALAMRRVACGSRWFSDDISWCIWSWRGSASSPNPKASRSWSAVSATAPSFTMPKATYMLAGEKNRLSLLSETSR